MRISNPLSSRTVQKEKCTLGRMVTWCTSPWRILAFVKEDVTIYSQKRLMWEPNDVILGKALL